MRKTNPLLLLFVLCMFIQLKAQNVSINNDGSTADPSAMLEVKATDKGILIPRLTTMQRTEIAAPAIGLMVYDINTKSFWYYDGTIWVNLLAGASGWQLTGNNVPAGSFLGTTNNQNLLFKANDIQAGAIDIANSNTSFGLRALADNTMGVDNTATGVNALVNNTTGISNTAVGGRALISNNTGRSNTGLGYNANVSADNLDNATAIGAGALVNASQKMRLGSVNVTEVETQMNFNTVSDGRFKSNVIEEVKGLDFITRLRPVVYNFDTRRFDAYLHKNMPDNLKAHLEEQDYSASTAIRQSGFIAQEVEQAMKASGYNFNGLHQPANEDDYYSIAYSQFVMPLVKSVQELNEKVMALEKENTALKANRASVEDLQARLQVLEAQVQALANATSTGNK